MHPREVRTARFELREALAIRRNEEARPYDRIIWEGAGYTVEVVTLDHGTPSLGSIVREKPRRNIDMSRLAALGLRTGPWLKQLKEPSSPSDTLVIDDATFSTDELRKEMVVETPGESLAYLIDFTLDEPSTDRLAEALRGCRTIICEASYRHIDQELARKNFHMTTVLSATLARRAKVRELVLFHLAGRYVCADWIEMLMEARQVFRETHFPSHWALETDA